MFSSVLLFLNIGGPEMILIVFVALLLFGGEKLPEIARGLGKGIRDFKDASEGVKREITNQINSYEDKKTEEPVHTYTAEETPAELPAAKEDHLIAEHSEDETGHGHEPTTTYTSVPNTMPFVEKKENHVAENHVSESHGEVKNEPVKTTHE